MRVGTGWAGSRAVALGVRVMGLGVQGQSDGLGVRKKGIKGGLRVKGQSDGAGDRGRGC